MKTKIIIAVLLCFTVVFAQQKKKEVEKSKQHEKLIELKEYPKPLTQISPVYPQLAKLSGIQGKVYVETLIDEEGNVVSTKVFKSDHEVFNAAAVEAIKAAKFSPGISKEGKKVKSNVVIPITFKLEEKKSEQEGISDQQKGEEEFPDMNTDVKVEKLPEFVHAALPVYPEEAKVNNITGKVYVKVLIDKEGNPKKAVVIKSENEKFNESAQDAAMKSKFTPALQGGKPVAVWVVLPYKFALDADKK